MSLSEAPSVKITYSTPQDVSDEVLGGVIHFCRDTGYKQNIMMLTFFWSSFLLSSKKTLDENGILNDTLNCFARSLGKVFPKVSEDAGLKEQINNMRQQYWNQLCADFDSLRTEAEIVAFIKIADELNKGDNASAGQLKKDPLKTYSQYASNISSGIYRILHDIDNGICIQYKYVLDEFRYARAQQQPKTAKTEPQKRVSVNTPSTTNNANGQPLGMAWYKFLIYFSLIAGAIINIIYIFAEFFIRANALEVAPSQDVALKFSDEYIVAVTNSILDVLPEAKPFFVDMFYSRASLYDGIVLNSKEPPIHEVVEVLSHIIHKEVDENKYIEVTDKNFRYFGGIIENLAIRTELVALFECIHSCTKETMDELKEYLKSM